ncbi:MAG: HDOD domain-containing protein [Planctomycetota bacterium]
MTSTAAGGIDPQKVEQVLAQLESLPPLAPVVTRILALTEDAGADVREIINLISTDPSLTTRVLSMLGRAEHGVRSEAISVENAVKMLGLKAIRQITLSVKILQVFGNPESPGEAPADFDRAQFWRHCLGTACAARRIAMAMEGAVEPEEAFVLGLLHDIGKIALTTVMPKSFARIVRTADRERNDIADVERAVLGVDHTVVGRRLAERWGLPQSLLDTIWLHHQPPDALPPSVAAGRHVQIVQLADALVREQRVGYSGNHRFITPSSRLAELLGIAPSDWTAIVESLADEIETRAEWIGVEEITSREVYLRALLQTTEELSELNAALAERNRRLERKGEYFAALGGLNRSISPTATVRDVCGAGAEAIRRALHVHSALVFVTSDDNRWADVGVSDGTIRTEVLERPGDTPDDGPDRDAAIQLAGAGTWISAAGGAFELYSTRYRDALGQGSVWLLPLVRESRWVGGSLFVADAETVASLRRESAEIGALSAALGLAVAQSRARSRAVALSDELAEITRRWAATQAELVKARTLESVVKMAAGAAHELNNPLAVISGRAQMLMARSPDTETSELLGTIVKQTQACSDIVTDLMEFAKPRPPRPEPIGLQELLSSVKAELVGAGLLDAMCLTTDVPSDTLQVWFDREQLHGALRELLENAVAATDSASRLLTVKACAELTEETVAVRVTDNGCGMSKEDLANAMDPFFSHHPAGRRRGLGLARVGRWLRLNGGDIRIQSQPGEGTTVELQLPIPASGRANQPA